MKSTREEVFDVLSAERDYQQFLRNAADGTPPTTEEYKSIEQLLLYMADYLQEASHSISRTWGPTGDQKALHAVRKVTALGVAMMEIHGAVRRVCITPHPEIGVQGDCP